MCCGFCRCCGVVVVKALSFRGLVDFVACRFCGFVALWVLWFGRFVGIVGFVCFACAMVM